MPKGDGAMAGPVKLIPLGGAGEIGLNMMVIEDPRAALVVDTGLMFPEDYMFGVDFVIPDISYLRTIKDKLRAIIFTHGHEDHIGAYPYLWEELADLPVYGTGFTLGLLEQKVREHKGRGLKEYFLIKPGDRISIGDFEVEFFRVCHSIPDCVGLALFSSEGTVVHTSDLKLEASAPPDERTDLGRLAELGRRGVDLLILDSTNADRRGFSLSEREVREELEELVRAREGRVIVALFASNIRRIGQLMDIAHKTGRKVALVGKSLLDNTKLASELGYIQLPPDGVRMEEIEAHDPRELLVITTGSQAEPMSALSLMASGCHKYLRVRPGDTIILSSRFITGKERSITHMINSLAKQGAEVIYADLAPVHASGHAHRKELEMVLGVVGPRYLMPIHGEYRHLVALKGLAEGVGIPPERVVLAEDGQAVVLEGGKVRLGEKVEAGRVFVDGKGIGDVEDVVLRDRRHLSEDGIVVSVMAIKEGSGDVVYGPEIITKGVLFEEKAQDMLRAAREKVLERCRELSVPGGPDETELEEEIRRVLKRFFKKEMGRFPIIIPVVIRM